MQKIAKYSAGNKTVEASIETDDGIVVYASWGIRKESFFRLKHITIQSEANGCGLSGSEASLKKRTTQELLQLAEEILLYAQAELLKHLTDSEIERKMADGIPQSKPKPKLSKAQQEKNALIESVNSMNSAERADLVSSYGVFYLSKDSYTNEYTITTGKTLSLVNFKRCLKLAGGRYMKSINFTIPMSAENCMELLDISIKTNKYSQQALDGIKRDRLNRKHAPSKSSRNSFQQWYDDADMPHKIDGQWVDLETGIPYKS